MNEAATLMLRDFEENMKVKEICKIMESKQISHILQLMTTKKRKNRMGIMIIYFREQITSMQIKRKTKPKRAFEQDTAAQK